MARVNTEEFKLNKTKIFSKVGVLVEIEEIRENRVTELVGGLHVCAKVISQRKFIEQKLNEHIAIIVIQDTIHTWYQFRNWERSQRRTAAKDKEIETLKKKLAEEIAKREAAEKALFEMKIKNVDLEALVQKFKEDIESKKVSLDKADMKSREEQEHIEELQGDIKRGKEDLGKLQNENIEHKTTIAKKDSVIIELNKDIEDKEGEISDSKKKLVVEEDNSKDLETQLHEKEDDIGDLEKQVKNLQNTISDTILPILKNDLKKTQLALDDTEKKLDKQVAQNKKVSDEKDGYNQQLQAEKTKAAALTSANGVNDKMISALNSEKDELEDKNRKLDSFNKDAQRKLAELVKRIEDGLNDSDMLKAQKADYEAQIQALKDDMEKTGKDLAGAKSIMNQKDVELNNLSELLAE
ncbi:myosin-7, putative [Entamoeba invadens IP1]|uniref:Myosin-7, putative n=1 Tax=Entamoeba invadens IP1 TaxID=370355 RepID=L7FMA7_ENTIV|nr:myosin-7, putative [Entamoeba invadens IP1]ELP88745.1 myosin-7, putative [Entamoeba invadens IP1]|eukprot:XP_004255516.1 myosin-7, putative [Entamoeba invadens IP1]